MKKLSIILVIILVLALPLFLVACTPKYEISSYGYYQGVYGVGFTHKSEKEWGTIKFYFDKETKELQYLELAFNTIIHNDAIKYEVYLDEVLREELNFTERDNLNWVYCKVDDTDITTISIQSFDGKYKRTHNIEKYKIQALKKLQDEELIA